MYVFCKTFELIYKPTPLLTYVNSTPMLEKFPKILGLNTDMYGKYYCYVCYSYFVIHAHFFLLDEESCFDSS